MSLKYPINISITALVLLSSAAIFTFAGIVNASSSEQDLRPAEIRKGVVIINTDGTRHTLEIAGEIEKSVDVRIEEEIKKFPNRKEVKIIVPSNPEWLDFFAKYVPPAQVEKSNSEKIPHCLGDGGNLANCTSLLKWKENISDLSLGLETVLKLRPVSFDWKKTESLYARQDLGFIAEEVESINTLLVKYSSTGELEGVRYTQMVSLLTKAIQELSGKLDNAISGENLTGGQTNAWAVDQSSGKVNVTFYGTINLNGNDIINVSKILGMDGKWKIDESGNITSKSLNTKKICLDDLCIDKEKLKILLESAGIINISSTTPSL